LAQVHLAEQGVAAAVVVLDCLHLLQFQEAADLEQTHLYLDHYYHMVVVEVAVHTSMYLVDMVVLVAVVEEVRLTLLQLKDKLIAEAAVVAEVDMAAVPQMEVPVL
jgi:hypothetical protein